jgi:hypothetical protein
MPGSVISDHVWLNKAGTGVATQAVLKRYLVSALNGSADDGHAHNPSLSGEEGEYTPRLLYCVRPDSLCCRSDPQSKNAVHNIPSQFRPGYRSSTVRCSMNCSKSFTEYITMPPTLLNGGLEGGSLFQFSWFTQYSRSPSAL